MSTSLLGTAAAILTRGGSGAVRSVAQLVGENVQVERVSITFFEDDQFTVVASAGWDLLGRGARLPLETSTHFSTAAAGQPYFAADFRNKSHFSRPVDQLVIGNGFRSGCSIPMKVGDRAVGAISLSSARTDLDIGARFHELAGVATLVAVHRLNPASRTTPTVLVCIDRLLVAHGIARLLESTAGLSAIVVTTVADAVRRAADPAIAAVFSDTYFGGGSVKRLMEAIRPLRPSARLIVVSDHDLPRNRQVAAAAGAAAFLTSASVGDADLVTAVLAGAARPAAEHGSGARAPIMLTPREVDVLVALDRGLTVRRVAAELGLTEATVKGYTRSLFTKLDAHSRSEAVHLARVHGILDSVAATRAR
jgi:DNA-binding NarL/FixJ family response regulator